MDPLTMSTTHTELPNSPVLTVDQIANYLNIPRSSAYKACKRGDIPCVKVGHHIRIGRDKFLGWLDRQGNT